MRYTYLVKQKGNARLNKERSQRRCRRILQNFKHILTLVNSQINLFLFLNNVKIIFKEK